MPTHPSPERLDDYLCGRLDAQQCETIERHFDTCPDCVRRTAERQPHDALLDLLQEAHQSGRSPSVPKADLSAHSSQSDQPGATEPRATDQAALAAQSNLYENESQWLSLATESFQKAGLDEWYNGEVQLKDHPRYEILRPLGRGGMGVVWLARHKTMERLVALKIIRRSMRSNDRLVSWFRNEARLISKLKHPNIVSAYDAEDSADHRFIVFEYIEGETLSQIARGKPLDEREALSIIRTVGTALAYAHAQGLVHRDIKPGNLIRDLHGVIKILDFGIASEIEDAIDSESFAAPVGTRAYLAPECFRSAPPSSATDIYALGCTLYYLLVGQPATAAIDATGTVDLHSVPIQPDPIQPAQCLADGTADSESISHLCQDPALTSLSEPTQQLILKMTARLPSQRPASAEEVIREIDWILSGAAPVECAIKPSSDHVTHTARWRRRQMVGAMGCASALAVAAFFRNPWQSNSDQASSKAARESFLAACPGFAMDLEKFGAGSDEMLLEPTKLGDGEARDYKYVDQQLAINVFETGRQVWLNYQRSEGRRLSLFLRAQVSRYQPAFSNFKVAFLDNIGRECNFQWVHDGQSKRLLMEVVTKGLLTAVWRQDLDADELFRGDIAMHMDGSSLEVYWNGQFLSVQACEDSPNRFPAIAAIACDAHVCALARVHPS